MDGVGVNERDLQPEEPFPRPVIDQIGTCSRELGKRNVEICHLVGDMVHPRAALGEEPADRGVVPERRQQLDATLPGADRGRLDPLLGNGRAMLDLSPEEPLVRAYRFVEILDGNAKVVNAAGVHLRRCYLERDGD